MWKITNGGSWPEHTLSLSATISAGDVYVICDDGTTNQPVDPAIIAECDETWTQGNFNGDDALALVYNSNIIDQIGEEGADPGNGWTVGGIADATKDHTLVRKASVGSGNSGDWASSAGIDADDSEWIVYDKNTWDYLGSHNYETMNIRNEGTVPDQFTLFPNYPNPFNPTTTISFSIPKFGLTTITAYDITGRQLETLSNEVLSVGCYSINWNASSYPSSVYLIRMISGDFTQTQKVVLVK